MTLTLLDAANVISKSREKNRNWPGEFVVLENTGAIGKWDEEIKQLATKKRRIEWAARIERQIVYPRTIKADQCVPQPNRPVYFQSTPPPAPRDCAIR